MKKYNLTTGLILLVFVLAIASCSGGGKKAVKESLSSEADSMEVSIGGMSCTGCEQTIQGAVGKLEGVKSVKASFIVGKAVIQYLPGIVDTMQIREAITGSGYKVIKFSPVHPEGISN